MRYRKIDSIILVLDSFKMSRECKFTFKTVQVSLTVRDMTAMQYTEQKCGQPVCAAVACAVR